MSKNNKQIWVNYNQEKRAWEAQKTHAKRVSFQAENKSEVEKAAHDIAVNQGLELIVQKKDGQIGYRNSFGNDPREIKG